MLPPFLGPSISNYGIPKGTVSILGVRQSWGSAKIEMAQVSLQQLVFEPYHILILQRLSGVRT